MRNNIICWAVHKVFPLNWSNWRAKTIVKRWQKWAKTNANLPTTHTHTERRLLEHTETRLYRYMNLLAKHVGKALLLANVVAVAGTCPELVFCDLNKIVLNKFECYMHAHNLPHTRTRTLTHPHARKYTGFGCMAAVSPNK